MSNSSAQHSALADGSFDAHVDETVDDDAAISVIVEAPPTPITVDERRTVDERHVPTARVGHSVSLLTLDPSKLVGGKYRVEGPIGRGGMSVVMSARHEALDHRVAIKFLTPALAGCPDAAARFAREARSAACIRNEHVAHVYDVGSIDDGTPYMIIEHLEGSDLGAILLRHGRLSIGTAVDYVLQAIDGVADAHMLGIVHRDLKPANLFLTRRADGSPLVKVLDFGIAKAADGIHDDPNLTAPRLMMGTPRYMSPEQIRSSNLTDARSDVWSMGVILYELLTAHTPFARKGAQETLLAVLQDMPRSPRKIVKAIPTALDAVVMRCLARDLDDRFQDVGALARALAPFAPPRAHPIVERFATIGPTTRELRPRMVDDLVSDTLVDAVAVDSARDPNTGSQLSRRRGIAWLGAALAGVTIVAAFGLAAVLSPERVAGNGGASSHRASGALAHHEAPGASAVVPVAHSSDTSQKAASPVASAQPLIASTAPRRALPSVSSVAVEPAVAAKAVGSAAPSAIAAVAHPDDDDALLRRE